MLIGPHIGRDAVGDPMDPKLWWDLVEKANFTAFQTHVYNPGSLSIPDAVVEYARSHAYKPQEGGRKWFFHASYLACISPNERAAEGTSTYLRRALEIAHHFGVSGIVVHTGATSGKAPDEVNMRWLWFIHEKEKFSGAQASVHETYMDTGVKIAIELAANKAPLNLDPLHLAQKTSLVSGMGWCLDTAHCYAAGVSWERLMEVCDKFPPLVCHANFPGSPFGSGRDVHGWRSAPQTIKVGKEVTLRDIRATADAMTGYDTLIRLLVSKNVPLIMEGSGFQTSNWKVELKLMNELFGDGTLGTTVVGDSVSLSTETNS